MAVLLLDALAQITARLEALERRAAVFTATQRNMLLAMGGSRVLRFLVREGFHDVIRARLSWIIYVALFVTFISVPGIFLDKCSWLWVAWLFFWTSAVVLVLAMMIENERLMSRVLARFIEERSQPSGDSTGQ